MPSADSPRGQPFGRDEGRHVFGRVAAAYAEARPDYPDRVYEILRERCGLGPSSRVLEIGAGSGQATRRLADSGASIVAIEPSEAVVEQLRARLGAESRVEVVVSAFEDLDLTPSSFDLVAVATAFHWLDPETTLPRIASSLRTGGWLAVWWNAFGDPDLPDPFHDATEPLLRNNVQGPWAATGRVEYGLDVAARVRELADHGFRDVEHEAVRWTLHLDAAGTRRLYSTFSNIARLPDAERETLLHDIERIATDTFDDHVERQMVTAIYTAHR